MTEEQPDPLKVTVNGNVAGYAIESYGGRQDANSTVSIEDNGNTLRIVGNGWKKLSLPYTVTADTVLEFDFRSGARGEVHGIGLDTDNAISSSRTFKLYGTQGWGVGTYNNYMDTAPETKHYVIPVGQHFTGAFLYLIFVNDHDVSNPTAESVFSNIKVYEAGSGLPIL